MSDDEIGEALGRTIGSTESSEPSSHTFTADLRAMDPEQAIQILQTNLIIANANGERCEDMLHRAVMTLKRLVDGEITEDEAKAVLAESWATFITDIYADEETK